MANQIPLKAHYTGSDTTALGEFESGDTLDSALLDTGTGANQIVKLDGSAKLPAVDGSQLTNLPASGGGGGGGGAWAIISTSTVSSAVSEVEFSLSGYNVYKVQFWDLNWGGNENGITVQFTVGATGTYSESVVYMNHRHGGMNSSSNHSGYGNASTRWTTWGGFRPQTSKGTGSGELTIYNTVGMPNLRMESAHIDEMGAVGIGTNSGWARLEYPSSTATIGKIKFSGDQTDNFASGSFTLYGLN